MNKFKQNDWSTYVKELDKNNECNMWFKSLYMNESENVVNEGGAISIRLFAEESNEDENEDVVDNVSGVFDDGV